ncbi:helix-turn-helix transcriptional regulator [Vibrio agarivorans]|uniref:helix-turn-helix transcriptional regulator n=1 Tax=Vibrio agarivorans TaxID=153622 RepID=UPI0025B2D6F5|nr:WYL domain-containing protein [Vibrio agarivorans]MDN3660669.1 WYL domain-containing protein [Vibrio agarivorans]
MNSNSNPSSVRKLAILSKLSRHPVTAPELMEQLSTENINASLRTIQRDLIELSELFSLVNDGSKPKGWYCENPEGLPFSKMDLTTAVTFIMVEKYLYPMLTKSMQHSLDSYILMSKAFLVEQNLRKERLWNHKIVAINSGFQLLPLYRNCDDLEVLYQAVLQEKCLRLDHQSISRSNSKRYDFHPYGVVIRGERTYLIGHFDGRQQTVKLLTQRITNPVLSNLTSQIPSDFNLSDFIDSGQLEEQATQSNEMIMIKLWIDDVLKRLLEETPLSLCQEFDNDTGGYIVTAQVTDTIGFRGWLLSMCNRATVLEPLYLREHIEQTLMAAVGHYRRGQN